MLCVIALDKLIARTHTHTHTGCLPVILID